MKTLDKRGQKAGLPPGSLVHVGKHRESPVKIRIATYNETFYTEREISDLNECITVGDPNITTWINLDGVHNVALLETLGECFNIHPLVLEDILNTNQRPKIEDYSDYLYIVIKSLYYDIARGGLDTEQISLIIGENYVISFQEKDGTEGDIFRPARDRLNTDASRLRNLGADYLAYSLIDLVVDNYFVVIEAVGDRIELLEDEIVKNPSPDILAQVHDLKREIVTMRRTVWPLREVLSSYARMETKLIKQGTMLYLRDVYDHTIQAVDMIEIYRDVMSSLTDAYLSSVSYRLNEVMKLLTMISVIFIPLTFLAGVEGMNFKYMPELEQHMGYPGIWFVMITIAISMLLWFKKKKWL